MTVHDDTPASLMDLSSQFYLSEEDVTKGVSRGHASITKLAELNPYVRVALHENDSTLLDVSFLQQFQVIVACNVGGALASKLDAFCHANQRGFIWGECRGPFASAFVDFGSVFVVNDTDGRSKEEYVVLGITQSNPVRVRVLHEEERPLARYIDEGATVELLEVQGMTQINGAKGKVRFVRKDEVELEGVDSRSFHAYTTGGVLRETKQPKTLSFRPLSESRKEPGEFQMEDWSKWGRAQQLHTLFRVLDVYSERFGGVAPTSSEEHVNAFCTIAKELDGEIDAELATKFAHLCRGTLSPLCSFLGGVLAQEALKFTGKFTPISQWAYFDCLDVVPNPLPQDRQLKFDRFDGQRYVFGDKIQQALMSLRLFLVGSGALGCELLKGLACMGSCQESNGGLLTVTDMDEIERSNLNRQFLFRDRDIGQPKSVTAAKAARVMCPSLCVKPMTNPVGVDTEDVFDHRFWSQDVDVAINALDTWAARLYVDSKCVEFAKPLLESGTLGASGHTQIIVPYATLNFGATRIQKEVAVPSCTIHHFPHTIHHTITWAREQFDTLFVSTPQEVSGHASDPTYLSTLLDRMPPAGKVESLRRWIRVTRMSDRSSVQSCVNEARRLFEQWFCGEIRSLLKSQPPDSLDEEGLPFWAPPKRAPTPIDFDFSNPLHVTFLVAATRLLAFRHGLDIQSIDKHVVLSELAKSASFEQFSDAPATSADDNKEASHLAKVLGIGSIANDNNAVAPRLSVAKFEKDDDSNSHIDFIYSTCNLRAINYGITPIDRLEAKKIAGKIIPAMVTTTAAITGLVLMQLFHFAGPLYKASLEQFKNVNVEMFKEANLDLATCLLAFADPQPCTKMQSTSKFRAVPEGFTLWDTLAIDGDLTVQQVGSVLSKQHNISVKAISCEGLSLFRASDKANREVRAKMKVTDIYRELKGDLPSHKYRLVLSLLCIDKTNELEVELPTVALMFRNAAPSVEKEDKKGKKKKQKKQDKVN